MAFGLPDWFSFAGLLDVVFGNIVWFMVIGALGFAIFSYLRFGTRKRLRPINRSEIEKINFRERMKNNANTAPFFRVLKRGNSVIGKITHFSAVKLKESKNPHPRPETEICMMLVKPLLLNNVKLNMSNPLTKAMCIQINKKNIKNDLENKAMVIDQGLYLDNYFGIFYDKESEDIQTALIKNDTLMRTDLNILASIYFAKSQEQATFDPEHAHALALKEKEIQVEMAKRSGKLTSI